MFKKLYDNVAESVSSIGDKILSSEKSLIKKDENQKTQTNKMSKYAKMAGCAALGVGAVAAAPFTGGGSLLGVLA